MPENFCDYRTLVKSPQVDLRVRIRDVSLDAYFKKKLNRKHIRKKRDKASLTDREGWLDATINAQHPITVLGLETLKRQYMCTLSSRQQPSV